MSMELRTSNWGFFLSWPLLGSGVLLEILFPGMSDRYRTVPFLLSIVLFGLPHGAADLMLLQTHLGLSSGTRLLKRFASYLGLMGGAMGCLLLVPEVVLVLFLVLSAWHFGASDVHDLRLLGHHEVSRWRGGLRALSRGTLLLAVPLAAWPGESLRIAEDWMGILRPDGVGILLSEAMLANLATGAVWLALLIAAVLLGDRFRRGKVRTGLVEAIETALLVTVLARLDPLFAVGLYFLACHSLRHVVKLMAVWSPDDAVHPWWTGLKTVYVKSLPLLLPTLAILGALGAWAVQWQPDKLAVLLLMAFAVVTLSHHLLVDRVFGLDNAVRWPLQG